MSKPLIAILIPTIVGREHFYERLMGILNPQLEKYGSDIQVITLKDNREQTIGEKRNALISMAVASGAKYRCFIDDDDKISDDYIELNMPGIILACDCNSLIGIYSTNGVVATKLDGTPKYFLHSIKYDHAWENESYFFRPPNHLNWTKLDLVKDIPYQISNFGEDMTNAMQVFNTGRLKNEYEINKPYYYYLSRSKVNGI